MKIKATYIGKDGDMGYRFMQEYTFVVKRNTIYTDSNALPCPYSVEGFLNNWIKISYLGKS